MTPSDGGLPPYQATAPAPLIARSLEAALERRRHDTILVPRPAGNESNGRSADPNKPSMKNALDGTGHCRRFRQPCFERRNRRFEIVTSCGQGVREQSSLGGVRMPFGSGLAGRGRNIAIQGLNNTAQVLDHRSEALGLASRPPANIFKMTLLLHIGTPDERS
ncbi:MAG: hypothetical protein KGK16_04625 [Bradyrhizobium sp.]|nr:hypothetical protein [Bradyrhizobium sp.]